MPVPLRSPCAVRSSQRLRLTSATTSTRSRRCISRMVDCRVAVEVPHWHRATGNRFHIGIEMKCPVIGW